MRIALNSPIVVTMPGAHHDWEKTADITDLSRIVEKADELGYHHVTCSEHVMVPTEIAEQRGGTYWDPLSTFGYLAARTSRIRLATQVLVLGYHHPLEIAKRYGTLDTISGGRLVLGLGVGSLQEEFEMLGATFEGRGAIADDALKALRAAMASETPSYHGEHFSFDDIVVRPNAVQDQVPLWIGGRTRRSLRRAATLGDGWVPFGLPLDELRHLLDDVETPQNFEVVLGTGKAIDPIADPDDALRRLGALADAGTTVASVKISATSVDHFVEQLEALTKIAPESFTF